MRERFRIVEDPRVCSYLPYEVAALEYRGILDMSGAEYAALLARGYRRFGAHLFRPACPQCEKCRSIRILAQEFVPDGNDRRVLKKNADVRAELHPLFVTQEHIDLYN